MIGAAIVRNTQRVRVLLASAHPTKHKFITAARFVRPWERTRWASPKQR